MWSIVKKLLGGGGDPSPADVAPAAPDIAPATPDEAAPAPTPHEASPASQGRAAKVFISSTFLDFQAERDLLVRRVFPSLRRRFALRGVDLIDIDLRWGVTEEQATRGDTVALCLAEIDRCRPLFLALVGDRVGWTPPQEALASAAARHRFLADPAFAKASVTEIEIEHGVFRAPRPDQAIAIIRAPHEAASEPRLERLKSRLRASQARVSDGLSTADAIAEAAHEHLEAVLDALFPEGAAPPDPMEAAQTGARERLRRDVVESPATLAELDAWVDAPGASCAVLQGPSGADLSVLAAEWAARLAARGDTPVFAHFVEAGDRSSEPDALMRRCAAFVEDGLGGRAANGDPLEDKRQGDALALTFRSAFLDAARDAAQTGRPWVFVLDGLARLRDRRDLQFFPPSFPDGVKVLLTADAADGAALAAARARGASEIAVEPLRRDAASQLIDHRLKRGAKTLTDAQRDRFLAHPQSGSPQFLRLALDELRVTGVFERLDAQIAELMTARSVEDLLQKTLDRLGRDFGEDLARRALVAIAVSRSGLLESELLGYLKAPQALFAPLRTALLDQDLMFESAGRLSLAAAVARAALERWAPSESALAAARRALGDWFAAQEAAAQAETPGPANPRTVEEAPWLFMQAQAWDRLEQVMLAPATWPAFENDVNAWRSYWTGLETHGFALAGRHEAALDRLGAAAEEPDGQGETLNLRAARLLLTFSRASPDIVERLQTEADRFAGALARAKPDDMFVEFALPGGPSPYGDVGPSNQARPRQAAVAMLLRIRTLVGMALFYLNEVGRSADWHAETLAMMRRYGGVSPGELALQAQRLGSSLSRDGRYDEAADVLQKGLDEASQALAADSFAVTGLRFTLGDALLDVDRSAEAERHLTAALTAFEARPTRDETLIGLTRNSLGALYRRTGRLQDAIKIYRAQAARDDVLFPPEYRESLNVKVNLASVLIEAGLTDEAAAILEENRARAETALGATHAVTINLVYTLGEAALAAGRLADAEAHYKDALARQEALDPKHPLMADPLNRLAKVCREAGRIDEAAAYFRRSFALLNEVLGPARPETRGVRDHLLMAEHARDAASREDPFEARRIHVAALTQFLAEKDPTFGAAPQPAEHRRTHGTMHLRTAELLLGAEAYDQARPYAEGALRHLAAMPDLDADPMRYRANLACVVAWAAGNPAATPAPDRERLRPVVAETIRLAGVLLGPGTEIEKQMAALLEIWRTSEPPAAP